jgi:arylsulfatase A-like enzyme
MIAMQSRSEPSSNRRPFNMVVIIVDALCQGLPEYGYGRDLTAGARRFLKSAIRFQNCYSPAGWTLPGCASIVTGLLPEQHGLVDHNARFQDPKLGHHLGDGYHRIGIANNGNMVSDHISFEALENIGHKKRPKKWNHFGWDDGFDRYLWTHRHDHEAPFRQATDFLGDRPPGRYMLFFHTNIVHDYCYDSPYYLSGERWLDHPVHESLREFRDGPHVWRQDIPGLSLEAKREQIRAKYDGGVEHAFQKLGELFELIDFEDTIVALVSDHGEGFQPEYGRVHHCGRLHEDLLRVPLFVWLPGELREKYQVADVEGRFCSTIDIVPTMLRLLGDEVQGFPGEFLFDLPAHRMLEASDFGYIYWDEDMVRQSYDECRIEIKARLQHPLKTISRRRDDDRDVSFFNLLYDPDERHDLIASRGRGAARPISFIVAVNDQKELENNLLASPVADDPAHQWILVENAGNSRHRNIGRLYNEALDEAEHELVFFFHQDVYIPLGWQGQLESSLTELEARDPAWGVVGAVGRLAPANGVRGKVIGRSCDPNKMWTAPDIPLEVQCLDEQWLGIRKSSGLRFDDDLPGFHCYGIDLSLTALDLGMKSYIVDAFVWHKFRDNEGRFINTRERSDKIVDRATRRFQRSYRRSVRHVAAKWEDALPVNSTSYLFTTDDLAVRNSDVVMGFVDAIVEKVRGNG